jgi:hypothetical protein
MEQTSCFPHLMNVPVPAQFHIVTRFPGASLLLLLALLALQLSGTGCTQTRYQSAQSRYWDAVTERLDFNRGLPRQRIVTEEVTTTQTVQTFGDK